VFPDDAPPTVVADASRLRRVLDNLIENALRHGGSGGRIEIGVERRNGAIRVFVDDAGPGIPEEMRERVFAKFFRVPGTSRHGTGLGLSIVRDIVRSHGGEVGVDQAPMGGARVWFTIPQVRETDADHDEASGPSPPTS
jgi:signal transduction histidine kinase